MRQFTNESQTAKLIELGFEKPKSVTEISWSEYEKDSPIINANTIEYTRHYSIGELIEMLQKQVYQIEDSGIPCDLNIHYDGGTWLIVYICERDGRFKTERLDLIDALYDMIVKLKEEGVI